MESFAEAYKEACKLELKYKHLFHACKSLLLPWPNREQDGRTTKEHKKEAELGEDESQQPHHDVAKPHKDGVSKANELADLQALDNILCRAQQIRQGDKPKRTTTTSIAMAMLAYGQSKPVKTKTVRTSKAISSSAKVSERYLPKNPNTAASMTRLHPPCGEASTYTTSDHTHTQDDIGGFSLQLNGQRLSMASKYCKLKNFLTRINERQIQQQAATGAEHFVQQAATPSTHSAGAEHFAQRLLPQESVGQAVAIEMLLAVEEYAVIKEELLTISPKEWAVCDKQQWQDLLRVKTKLDSILTRVGTLSKKTNTFIPTVSETCLHKAPKSSENRLSNEGCCEQLGYVGLQKLKQLCMLEQQLLLDNWEMEVVAFIGETVLPLLECEQHRVSTELLKCIHELLGAQSETVTYVFVDR